MPVTYGAYTKQLKLLPLTLQADGAATVVVRYGYVGESGVFEAATERTIPIVAADVSAILDAPPTPGLSRRNDLSLAVYTHLVQMGVIEAGEIS